MRRPGLASVNRSPQRGPRLVAVALLAAVAACGEPRATGTYLLRSGDGLITLTLIQRPDGSLTGRGEVIQVAADGGVNDRGEVATGAEDGGAVSLTMKDQGLLAEPRPYSGTLSDGVLTLDGTDRSGNHVHFTMRKASQSEVQQVIADLERVRLSRVAAARAAREAAAAAAERADRNARAARDAAQMADERAASMRATEALTTTDFDVTGKQGEIIERLRRVDGRLRDLSARMQAGVVRERAIVGDGQAAVARSQIAVAVNQLDIQARQIEMSFGSAATTYGQRMVSLERENIDDEQGCHAAHASTAANPVPDDIKDWNRDCLLLFDASRAFEATRAAVGGELSRLERAIAAQRALREQLVASAEGAE